MIDLRSDTVTQPTPEMRRAMAEAPVGDAVIDTDPTTERLERFTAELLGKESALFMPSGTMTNQIGIRLHCDRGSELICEADAHVYHYEQGAFAQLSGIVAHTIAGKGGVLTLDQLQGEIRPDNDHMVRTRLVCLENTHNRWGGLVLPQDEVVRLCEWATASGLKTHLDGARLWNAAAATGTEVAELAKPFDSVSVCFSKGLGAPVGSALVGERDFIREAKRARKLFGGGMRQSGILAAGALHALEHHRERLVVDHANAQSLADAACRSNALRLRGHDDNTNTNSGTGKRVGTNIVTLEIDPTWGDADEFRKRLLSEQVDCFAIGPQAVRLVTHLDVSSDQIEQACAALTRVASDSSTKSRPA
ncbi:MAG: low specificity L-threonine aldolase [Planctomycetota bacterium]